MERDMNRNLIYPLFSKSAVNAAAKNIVDAQNSNLPINPDDEIIIENWRASHTHVLNTWQVIFRQRIKNKKIVFAQRLKRKNTIYDKIGRYPNMKLARMHDIAGCRLIFKSIKELNSFRDNLHAAKFKHILKENECKNYIDSPKESGYRGIHDVYIYQSRKGNDRSEKWNGLSVEIQYRTVYQHAWATAVEVADSLTKSRSKFSQGDQKQLEFFKLASEIIARVYEKRSSCKSDLSDLELAASFLDLEKEINLLKRLKQIRIIHDAKILEKNVVLFFDNPDPSKPNLEVFQFKNLKQANKKYFELEKAYPDKDIVLVATNDKLNKSIKNAFRNYFADTADFADYIVKGLDVLVDKVKKEA